MIIQQDNNTSQFYINKYEAGKIWINQQTYHESVLISSSNLVTWPVATLADLTIEHLEIILDQKPNIFILGTGPTYKVPNFELIAPLLKEGIGVEVMDSLKAAYTFVILSSEDRDVTAGIILT